LLFDEITPQAALAGTAGNAERSTMARFFAGEMLLFEGQRDAGIAMLVSAINDGGYPGYELVAARAELRRMGLIQN
jgi:hypothetical protein